MSSNKFFKFDNINDASESQEDSDYDALNGETFGDDNEVTDWETGHENYVSECKSTPYDELNSVISERVATSILDDEGAKGAGAEEDLDEPNFQLAEIGGKKIFTVQEIEANLKGINLNQRHAVLQPRNKTNASKEDDRPQHLPFSHNRQYHGPQRGRHFGGGRNATRGIPRFMPRPFEQPFEQRPQMPNQRYMHPAHRGMYMPGPPGPMPFPNPGLRSPHPYQKCMIRPPYHAGAMGQNYHHEQFLRQPPTHQPNVFNMPAPGPPLDEYAGLMRPQEKQWLASIQMMQLNTNQPFLDDYYYNMYNQRHQGHSSRKTNNKNFPNTRVVTYSRQPTRYVPLQFENSLGKLQVGSVTAPRKIIDMVVPCNNAETSVKHVDRKSKEILFEIEQLFNIVLKMEETSHHNISNSESPDEEEPNLQALQDKILKTLLNRDKLVSIMSIKKGKKVVIRLLPILDHPAPLVHQLLLDLVPIAKRDVEQYLLSFLPPIRTYISSVDLPTIVLIVKQYDSEFLLSTKFTTSVIATMIDRAAQVMHQCDDTDIIQEWKQTLLRLIMSTKQCTSNERAVIAVDKDVLQEQLNLVQGLFAQELADKLMRVISYHPLPPDTTSNGHN